MNSAYNETSTNATEQRANETISELAHRHIKDRNHTTTDEELRNAKIELSNIASINITNLYSIRSFRSHK